MEKFKLLRLKFEQRRSMRSQAAKAQALESEKANATSDSSKDNAKESNTIAKSEDVKQKPNIQQNVVQEPTVADEDNGLKTDKDKVKVVSMPVRRNIADSNEKPQPEMKFKPKGVVSMPVKKKPEDNNNQEQPAVKIKTNKDKVVSMPVKRRETTDEETKTEPKFKISKDKVVSMPVKRRDTGEKDKSDTSKRLSGTGSGISETEEKDTHIKHKEVKCVSMPIKPKTPQEKDTASGVKVKPSEHVSMPLKRKDTKEKEIAQTKETNANAKDISTEKTKGQKVNISSRNNDVKAAKQGEKPAARLTETNAVKDKKDRKIQFLSVNAPDDLTDQEMKPATLKGSVGGKTNERKLDTLSVEDYNAAAKERKSSLSEDKLQELEEAFVVFDQNRDGEITKEELGAVLYALGQRPTVTEVQALIRSVDLDKSGTIDFDEFVKIFSSKLTVDPEQELHEVFDIFDSNLDGFISDDELFAVLQKLGEHTSLTECKKMIAEADLNGDGKVDYREFKAILNSR